MKDLKTILAIESSCDETAAAVGIKSGNGVKILSNIVASSVQIQAKYGGVVPEQAAREQLKSIIPVIKESLEQSKMTPEDIDAIAVTIGPGLIGSLLVGVETAKTLALVWNKPLIPVNHLMGHFYANWILPDSPIIHPSSFIIPKFPCIGLLVSGGHTDLVLFESHGKYQYLGGTRDDAAGEAFDKTARLLNLPYPGGPNIAKLASQGDPQAFKLPRPMINSQNFDFSFSGLKTAVAELVNTLKAKKELEKQIANLCASIEQSIVDVLVKKTIVAAQKYNIDQIIVAGGVAANSRLSSTLKNAKLGSREPIFIPPRQLCTDNAAMIAASAFYHSHTKAALDVQATPELSLNQT